MWCVEIQIFTKVTLCFLVKGHNKNSADHLFNLLKLTYHFKDVFTYDQIFNVINENEYIEVHKITLNEMFNFLKQQDKFYRTSADEFKETHFFTISQNEGRAPTILCKQNDKEVVICFDSLLPTSRDRKCVKLLPTERKVSISGMTAELEVLTPAPLRDIKQLELYSKWGPLLPLWA